MAEQQPGRNPAEGAKRRKSPAVRRRGRHSRFTFFLALYFVIVLIIPNWVLAYTEGYSVWSNEALLLMPMGFFMMWSIALRRSGIMIWLGFPFIFFSALQLVLLYLFGDSIIATDMFTNLLTTNPGEATELLNNIYPAVILVLGMYLPLLWFASREIALSRYLSHTARKITGYCGIAFFVLGALALWPAYRTSERKHVLRDEIFPINVIYNMGLSGHDIRSAHNYFTTSHEFTYEAQRPTTCEEREIYVYVIGEASRAMNWQLYGYERETNPQLTQLDDIHLFTDILTQSNTTHKSVPMLLSSIPTDNHDELFRRTSIPALFNEVGFETWFISNQAPQGAMIDHLASYANHRIYIKGLRRYDLQLLETMQEAIAESTSRRLFFVLHCYGSHFSYHQRYPSESAYFQPDDDVAIVPQHKEQLMNAYDNSIRYTDEFLAATIDYLRSLDNTVSALLYCADHGEDLLDDSRERFLHASPTTTAYQLWVASFCWFSERYGNYFPEKIAAAEANRQGATTTHAMFHTMADMAGIRSPYLDTHVSLVSSDFDHEAPRYYLNDHSEAVPFRLTGLTEADHVYLEAHGLRSER